MESVCNWHAVIETHIGSSTDMVSSRIDVLSQTRGGSDNSTWDKLKSAPVNNNLLTQVKYGPAYRNIPSFRRLCCDP
jgi:hypothetical protein